MTGVQTCALPIFSDDGSLTGRGHPWVRGLICGLMTTAGGIGHTLLFLISDFRVATSAAVAIVAAELAAISFASPLHGYPLPCRCVPSCCGWSAGVPRRNPDRQFERVSPLVPPAAESGRFYRGRDGCKRRESWERRPGAYHPGVRSASPMTASQTRDIIYWWEVEPQVMQSALPIVGR